MVRHSQATKVADKCTRPATGQEHAIVRNLELVDEWDDPRDKIQRLAEVIARDRLRVKISVICSVIVIVNALVALVVTQIVPEIGMGWFYSSIVIATSLSIFALPYAIYSRDAIAQSKGTVGRYENALKANDRADWKNTEKYLRENGVDIDLEAMDDYLK